jgi:hypothetical protein
MAFAVVSDRPFIYANLTLNFLPKFPTVGAMQKRRIVADDAAAEFDFAHRRALPRVFGRKPPKNRNDLFGITFWTFRHWFCDEFLAYSPMQA